MVLLNSDYLLKRHELKKELFNLRKQSNFKKSLLSKVVKLVENKTIINYLSTEVYSLEKKDYFLSSNKITKDISILFLSDLHLEIVNNNENILALLKGRYYDVIIFGGDYYDGFDNLEESRVSWIDLISKLREHTDIICGVLGNHDDKESIDFISGYINLLINDSLEIGNLVINGIEDFVTFRDLKDFDSIDNEKFNILLSHTPDFVFEVDKRNHYDLMLSGHTHGGQISFFGFVPIVNCKDKRLIHGFWNVNGLNGITTSGVGCSGKAIRKNVKPEIVEIEIKKED